MEAAGLDPRAEQDLVRRLAIAHPSHPVEWIAALVTSALAETDGARVHAFRVTLAERTVRRTLKSSSCERGDSNSHVLADTRT